MHDQELEKFILRILDTLGSIGVTVDFLLQRARTEAWPQLTQPDLESVLLRLADQRLAMSSQMPLSALRWKITTRGHDTLRELGLA